MDKEFLLDYKNRIQAECGKVILGKSEQIDLITVCHLCGGNILFEDIPGTGKTLLLKTFSTVIGGQFSRIQFTPDVMPSDITGINFYNKKVGEFEFREGPVFANVVLADEINRSSPKTQSSLLEAMAERQVTVDGVTRKLPVPFMVAATQNPLESYGTYPLPEAQLDRFMMRLKMEYMTPEDEIKVARREDNSKILTTVKQVVTQQDTERAIEEIQKVTVSPAVEQYIIDIIWETRTSEDEIIIGASPRSTRDLYNACKAYVGIMGREFVLPEDVQKMAPHVLLHRMSYADADTEKKQKMVFSRLLERVKVPLEE
ncbi:MAG: AAA family ATPase [Clostridia bacterium]|nr:AAA family ATPase [Clostridia bacterium]